MLVDPQTTICHVFTLLCLTVKLLIMYCISITRYFAMLYWVWCSYHSYIKKAIRVKILWHHNGPFGLLSSHFFCFFKGVRPSLSGPTCYPHLFRMLGFDRSCTNLSFPTWWSFYSFWCSGICKDRYFSLPSHTTGYSCNVTWGCLITCLAFWKSNNAIISSNAIFFDGPTTWARIYSTSSRSSFECCANTSSLLCRSNNRGLVISSF
jgi:hypothetical protein